MGFFNRRKEKPEKNALYESQKATELKQSVIQESAYQDSDTTIFDEKGRRIDITGSEMLKQMAIKSPSPTVRGKAAKLIKDFDLRCKIMLEDENHSVQASAIEASRESQYELAQMAILAAEAYVAYHKRFRNDRFYFSDPNYYNIRGVPNSEIIGHYDQLISMEIMPYLTDKEQIVRILCAPHCITWNIKYDHLRSRGGWLQKVSNDVECLMQVIQNTKMKSIRVTALGYLQSLSREEPLYAEAQALLDQYIYLTCTKEQITAIKDTDILCTIAVKHPDDTVRYEALSYVQDSDTLYRVFKANPDDIHKPIEYLIHYKALEKLKDPEILHKILKGKPSDREKMMIAVNLQDQEMLESMLTEESIKGFKDRDPGFYEEYIADILLPAIQNISLQQQRAIQLFWSTNKLYVIDKLAKIIQDAEIIRQVPERKQSIQEYCDFIDRLP